MRASGLATAERRFSAMVSKCGPVPPQRPDLGPCWQWTGHLDCNGYGLFKITEGNRVLAHRYWFKILAGEIPGGLVLDHLCRNRRCVNPAHLEPVTNRTNTLRGESPTAVAYVAGRCFRGHALVHGNVYRVGHSRTCRTCNLVSTKMCLLRRKRFDIEEAQEAA